MTTVDALTLNKRIKQIADQGAKYLVLEVTSHALAEFRTLGIPIEIGIFTNLTHEHLDYHKTLEGYRNAKGKLFKKAKLSILNADDPATKHYTKIAQDSITYGIKNGENKPQIKIMSCVVDMGVACRNWMQVG
jgi:UDP-N-acetylmuramoyl-L-alanyl-D-glutamate--2,6-diaminopimelate ligase